jgi:hypothetical protein
MNRFTQWENTRNSYFLLHVGRTQERAIYGRMRDSIWPLNSNFLPIKGQTAGLSAGSGGRYEEAFEGRMLSALHSRCRLSGAACVCRMPVVFWPLLRPKSAPVVATSMSPVGKITPSWEPVLYLARVWHVRDACLAHRDRWLLLAALLYDKPN